MYDAIVVGAGPAGSLTAYHLASAGWRVLLLEKMKLPRYKPCGGGLSLKFLSTLPGDLSAALKSRVERIGYSYRHGDRFAAPLNFELAVVDRPEFDRQLAAAAVAAGAELKDGLAVTALALERDRFRVTAGRESFESKYLVGADGVYTRIGAWSGLVKNRRIGSALEVEVAGLPQDRRTALIDFGRVRGGYSWSFPRGDRFSVGLGGRYGEGLRAELANWLDYLGYRGDKELKLHGHALPEALIGARLQTGNLLLVGDAAGLVNPLTGEGIRYAIQSAALAAEAIMAGRIESYSQAVKEKITGDFRFSYWLRALFFRCPGFCYRVFVKNHSAARSLSRAFCGDATFKELFFSSGRKLLDPFGLLKGNALHAE